MMLESSFTIIIVYSTDHRTFCGAKSRGMQLGALNMPQLAYATLIFFMKPVIGHVHKIHLYCCKYEHRTFYKIVSSGQFYKTFFFVDEVPDKMSNCLLKPVSSLLK
jgi:predicted amidohydrolase